MNLAASRRIGELSHEVRYWRIRYDRTIASTALLLQRHDLPVDRIPAYRELERLRQRNDELERQLNIQY